MVHTRARAIHVVKSPRPKMRIGLRQKGSVAGTGSCQDPAIDTPRDRRPESTSALLVNLVERGKPVSFLRRR